MQRVLDSGWANRPFAPGVTMAELDRRLDAGATIEVCDGEPPSDAIPLAVVLADGSVDLQPGSRRRRPEGTLVALVGGT